MKSLQKQTRFFVGMMLVIAAGVISGCNLASESTAPAQNPDLTLPEPQATIRILTPPDANGYFAENSTVDFEITAKGSLGSDVVCTTTVSKREANTGVFTEVDTLTGCESFPVYVGSVPGDLTGVIKLKTTVTDGNSKTAEALKYLFVKNDQRYLKADFTAALSTGLQLNLDASTTVQGETGEVMAYDWKIYKKEDAGYTINATLLHQTSGRQTSLVLPEDGFYIVTLTVTDAGGKTATTQKFFEAASAESLTPSFDVEFPSVAGSSALPTGSTAPINLEAIVTNPTDLTKVNHFVWELYAVADGQLSESYLYRNTVESLKAYIPIVAAGTYVLRLNMLDASGNQHHVDQVFIIS